MQFNTERLTITELTMAMCKDVHLQSLDEATRRFVPDEVFEELFDALDTVTFLMTRYDKLEDPLVYAILLKDTDTFVGYVQLVKIDEGYEVGYHIGEAYRGKGYAPEAMDAFLPRIMRQKLINTVYGICHAENTASRRVLEKCCFTKIFEGTATYHGEEAPVCKYIFRR